MSERIPMIGRRFGQLTVLSALPTINGKRGMWLCRCDCGAEKAIYGGHLRAGNRISCGCAPNRGGLKHGMARTPEHRAWSRMKERCNNPHNKKYLIYGGRGIKVCERWQTFEPFYADMGPRPSADHTLERLDSNGNYEPTNCVWATYEQQNNNRPGYNRHLMLNGERITVAQAAKATGIPHATILSRLDAGKSDAEAVRRG